MRSRRGSPADPIRLLARLRVGTKLMLLALLPVGVLVAVTVVSAVSGERQASELRDFRSATRISFATAEFAHELAAERDATVLLRLQANAQRRAGLAATQRRVDETLRAAEARAAGWQGAVDVAARLDAASRQLHALRLQAASLSVEEIGNSYGLIVDNQLATVGELDAARPTQASGRAADAYLAILQAAEAADRERVDLAGVLAAPAQRAGTAARWPPLETAELDGFRQNAGGGLTAELNALLFQPAGITVQQVRDELLTGPRGSVPHISLQHWLTASGKRLSGLRELERASAGELAAAVSSGLKAANAGGIRDVGLSLAVLVVVASLAFALRQSITGPLREVSEGAQALSRGDLTSDVRYAGRDEIGDVAAAFRDLHVTVERLAGDLRAKNAAIRENRLEYRIEVGAYAGTWAQLLAGMNDTMAAFAELQSRRRRAERELADVFNLSPDLLSIAGVDGRFKRVNPAFEHTLGYTSEELLSKPFSDFIHPDDQKSSSQALQKLADGGEVLQFENRYIRKDGSVRWLQWNARAVPEEGLVYAAARDVTDSRRAAEEQASLRRVATLVAKGAPPLEVFYAVVAEVRQLLGADTARLERRETNGTSTIVALGEPDDEVPVHSSIEAPIVVEGRIWGVMLAAWRAQPPVSPEAEGRMAHFTELLATAIANADGRAQLSASRARLVATADDARRRIERDLHDGVQQRLLSLGLDLRAAEEMIPPGAAELEAQLEHIAAGLAGTLGDLRDLARGIHPVILSRGGLDQALKTLARRSAVAVELDLPTGLRLPASVEVAAYYVVSEALTNVAKHAQASVVHVGLKAEDSIVELAIDDDGVGGAEPDRGSGLIGLSDRVEAIGGRIQISSPPGRGTSVVVTLPSAEGEPSQGSDVL